MSLVLDTGTMKYRENPNQSWRPLVIKAGMNWESMADTYDPDNGTYEIGQYVLEDGVMYRCIYAIDTPEIWTPAHWIEINIGDELFSLRDSISSEAMTRASEDTLIRNTLNNKVLQPNARITVPTGSTGVTKGLTGLTGDHVLIKWNFYTAASGGSVIAENNPPQDMEWSTTTGSFTIKTVGSSSVYCQPVFALPTLLTAT